MDAHLQENLNALSMLETIRYSQVTVKDKQHQPAQSANSSAWEEWGRAYTGYDAVNLQKINFWDTNEVQELRENII